MHYFSALVHSHQSPYTYINQGLIHMNKTGFAQKTESQYEVLQMIKFLMFSQHINLSPKQHLIGCCANWCVLLLPQQLMLLGKVSTKLMPWEGTSLIASSSH
jgi:hypothetical protein